MRKFCAASFMALVLSGCASVGTNYDQNAVYRLRPGDDIRSVITALGRPNAETVDDKGNTVLVWVHSTASVLGAEARSVRLAFDPEGRLIAVPRQSAVARAYTETSGDASKPAPLALPTTADKFSAGVMASLQTTTSDALTKARTILQADGFALSDVGTTWLTTAPVSFALKPAHADCGRKLGIPYLADRRAKSTVAYRVDAADGSIKVRIALSSTYEAGYGSPDKNLSCVSTGELERTLLRRIQPE